jgi:tetratricopeptide (TPR) repeat protein
MAPMRRLAVMLGLCLAAPVDPVTAAPEWTYSASDHFEVYTTGGDKRARDALQYFEGVRAFFSDYAKLSPATTAPVRLVVFSSDKEFAPYRPHAGSVAFYASGPDRDSIVMRSLDARAYPVVVHEYVHLAIRYSGDRYPLWLNEGLAEFFSTLSAEGDKMSIGKVPIGRQRVAANASLLSLEQIFAVDQRSPDYNKQSHAGLFYSESWALTHMLLRDERYAPQSSRALTLIAGGTASGKALESVYGKPLASIFNDLRSYIQRGLYAYTRVSYTPPKPADTHPTRPVSAFEGRLVLATVLATRPDASEARAAFEALARENPNDLGLVESRAYLALRHRNYADAAKDFARAVELDSRNGALYRDYAIVVGPSDLRKAEDLLAKALFFVPGDLEARLRMADVLTREHKPDQALGILAVVRRVPAESAFRLFELVAIANLQANHLEEARSAAMQARQVAKPGTNEEQSAARLMASIDSLTPRPGPAAGASPREGEQTVVSGRITNMICDATPPILELAIEGRVLRLLFDDLSGIRVLNGTMVDDLKCGSQNTAMRVGYVPAVDDARKTAGKVRLLDFRKN